MHFCIIGFTMLLPREQLVLLAIQEARRPVTKLSIMDSTGYCRRTVITALRDLEGKGLVTSTVAFQRYGPKVYRAS